MGASCWVDSTRIRYLQDTAARVFRDGSSVLQLALALSIDPLLADTIEPIKVVYFGAPSGPWIIAAWLRST